MKLPRQWLRDGVVELGLSLACVLLLLLASCTPADGPSRAAPPPRLEDTGLYTDAAMQTVRADALPYTPQYPLWTDGAEKRRWIVLPAGSSIDASDADHWQFPVGTRLWKEFAFAGRKVETRYLERAADGWLYATYAWTADGKGAVLAPACGIRNACASQPGHGHDIPGVADCRACHEGGQDRVLGFSLLQLSSDRDPLAPHREPPGADNVDLSTLVQRGLVRHLPDALRRVPPRIAATSPAGRAALGYLHGNCSACHNGNGPLAGLGLRLDYPFGGGDHMAPAIATALQQPSHFTRAEAGCRLRLAAGEPEHSVLVHRLAAADPIAQMPPLGRHVADAAAVDLISAWVRQDLRPIAVPSVSQPEPNPSKEN